MARSLPLAPPEATPIAASFSHATFKGMTWYFSNLEPYDCHAAGDTRAMQLRIARLHRVSEISIAALVAAFGLSRSTVKRAVKLYDTRGEAGFSEPRRRRGRTVIDREMADKAAAMLASGMSGRAVAGALGVSTSTFNENLRAGVIDSGDETQETPAREASDRAERDSRDRQQAMGRACHDVEGRVLAASGVLDEATPAFTQAATAVSRGGVLAALPMLLKEGLLDAAGRLLRLPGGFYGVTTILLTVAFMTMARVRAPETLRYQAPGEWGILLGLDRCPEVKTLRRKIALIADSPETVQAWQTELARSWVEGEPEAWATLAVDGHVKVYTGRKGRLPKHFVARQKICLPASASYWINALSSMPLLCLHKELDPKMVRALEHDVVPELEALGIVTSDAPDLTAAQAGEPAVTLVFDREGWSPALFLRLARRGIACITWHKNFRGQDWPVEAFSERTVPIHGPAGTGSATVRLAEDHVTLSNGLKVRQIRRLLDNGRQVPLITTHPAMAMDEAAGAMFSRWSQENFFKYMRDTFNVDALPSHELVPVDPDALVVNPVRRAVEKAMAKVRMRLYSLRQRLVTAAGAGRRETVEDLTATLDTLDGEFEALKEQRDGLARHVRAGDLCEDDRLDALPVARRLFLDIIRMICYRAETRMMPSVIDAQGCKPNARKLLAALLTADANILPDHDKKLLRVQILGMASNATESALLPLIEQLNETRTVFPGTDMRLVYELAGESHVKRSI